MTGLAGTGLVLKQGSEELPITADGSFAFATEVAPGTSYTVTVAAQPTAPTQTCSVANGTGTAGTTDVTSVEVTCTTTSFTVGGTVTGLEGTGLTLENNNTDTLAIAADGTFTFATPVESGAAFSVTVASQPTNPTQTCTVTGGTGTLGDGNVSTVVVNCAVDQFVVGGMISGLEGAVVLQNNAGDDITVSANGSFAFPTTIASNGTYAVTVLTQPTTPSQTCEVTTGTGSGTVTDANITSVRVVCTTNQFAIGGTVTGLDGDGLVLQNNAGDNLEITADGTFTFPATVASGQPYAVTVLAQPSDRTQVCTVASGTGTVGGAAVTDVAVTCVTSTFTIGGTVTGLLGSGLVLEEGGGDPLPIAADGTFTFASPLPSGDSFVVTIASQPSMPTQTCTVSGGTGTVGAGPVTSVAVNCTTDRFAVGGSITGLAGTVVLSNNSGDALTLSSNGTFAFSTPIASGESYAVVVATQPGTPSQTCTVTSGTGTVVASPITSVQVTCVTNRFSVGGTVSGLAGTGLTLRNNGGAALPVTANGTFTFPATVASGESYAVTVGAQPGSPSQTCVVANGTGVIGGGAVTDVEVTCTTNRYTVGGTVTGLAGTGLVLQNSGGDNLPLSSNGTFAFPTTVASGDAYAVTVLNQPSSPTQTCVVTSGAGTVTSGPVTTVAVTCTTNRYAVGGTVSGLAGTGLVLTNNGGDSLPISANGTFTFPTTVASGAAYAVAVATQPSGPSQTCVVTGGTGTIVSEAVSSVTVNCTTNQYSIGGTVSGLVGTGLVLRNNAGADLPIGGNGSFAFPATIASGGSYAVTVVQQPTDPSQTCVVANGTGTVGGANVTNVAVTCTTNRYTVGGTVSGLAAGQSVVLANNGADNLTVDANGSFTFMTTIPSNAAYAVTVVTNPATQTCTVSNDAGVVTTGAVTNVAVTCTTNTYTVSAAVTGLTAGTLELANNGEALSVTANGTSAFPTPVASGATYAVTVTTQPAGLICTVTDGTGTITNANVTVAVACAPTSVCPFTFTNTAAEDLTGNDWFNACATATGNQINVVLRDTNGTIVYQASGSEVGTWTQDTLTSTAAPGLQYNLPSHDRIVMLGNGDRLLITGRSALQAGCLGSQGDGYGIRIYAPGETDARRVKLMIQTYRQQNFFPGTPRSFTGWTTSTEIVWNGGTAVNTCTGVTGFLGSFELSITDPI